MNCSSYTQILIKKQIRFCSSNSNFQNVDQCNTLNVFFDHSETKLQSALSFNHLWTPDLSAVNKYSKDLSNFLQDDPE